MLTLYSFTRSMLRAFARIAVADDADCTAIPPSFPIRISPSAWPRRLH